MQLMLVLLAGLTIIVIWALFTHRPIARGGPRILAYDIGTLAAALVIGSVVGKWIHSGAAPDPDKWALHLYLAIMAGGMGFNITIAVAGILRNLVFFPRLSTAVAQGPPNRR
ncbi:MAG: hypothetical protein HY017_00525 [Betaproteobacteria bacterium]|nr:hypothetical protein [Betaproteobacteria bacterium]